jgi:DNA (cytosine-5)-methyltransferase 1
MPRLLDLFCGEGGAARGYARAGFDVDGVDQNPNVGRRYPYTFSPGDALEYARTFGRQYDVIHASPPCQLYSVSHNAHTKQHPDLLAPTRDVLDELGVPYVIENVPGAPMLNPITLCGAAFGLTATDIDGTPLVLRRHRLFESNLWLTPVECECLIYRDRGFKVGGAYGNGSETPEQAKVRGGGYTPVPAVRAELLGIGWMTRNGLSQSIPPAYTQYLGEQLLEHLDAEVAS